jgi:hypothetical protein
VLNHASSCYFFQLSPIVLPACKRASAKARSSWHYLRISSCPPFNADSADSSAYWALASVTGCAVAELQCCTPRFEPCPPQNNGRCCATHVGDISCISEGRIMPIVWLVLMICSLLCLAFLDNLTCHPRFRPRFTKTRATESHSCERFSSQDWD